MGAKFLNDEEVASNDACMRLCCAVNECDVFIYEEKVKMQNRTLRMNHLKEKDTKEKKTENMRKK